MILEQLIIMQCGAKLMTYIEKTFHVMNFHPQIASYEVDRIILRIIEERKGMRTFYFGK